MAQYRYISSLNVSLNEAQTLGFKKGKSKAWNNGKYIIGNQFQIQERMAHASFKADKWS